MGYEVFAGNTVDCTTLEDKVELMEKKCGQPSRIWVMDRGMVSEDNLDFLRDRGARYLVGTPKGQITSVEAALLDQTVILPVLVVPSPNCSITSAWS